jgi:hypothetical protein
MHDEYYHSSSPFDDNLKLSRFPFNFDSDYSKDRQKWWRPLFLPAAKGSARTHIFTLNSKLLICFRYSI